MRLLKRISVILAIVLVSLGVGATAASANWDSCPAGERVCTYNNILGGGGNYNYSFTYVGNCINIGYPWNDQIRSLWNRSSHEVMFYLDAGCSNSWVNRWLYEPGDTDGGAGAQYSSLKWMS